VEAHDFLHEGGEVRELVVVGVGLGDEVALAENGVQLGVVEVFGSLGGSRALRRPIRSTREVSIAATLIFSTM